MSGIGSQVSDTQNIIPEAQAVGVGNGMGANLMGPGGTPYSTSNTETPHDFGRDGTFPNHPKVGPWYALAGEAMTPWEFGVIESQAAGETRHQTPSTITQKWDATGPEMSGEFDPNTLTHGKGQMAGPTDLPNHKSEG